MEATEQQSKSDRRDKSEIEFCSLRRGQVSHVLQFGDAQVGVKGGGELVAEGGGTPTLSHLPPPSRSPAPKP